jgi:hypothetical protein
MATSASVDALWLNAVIELLQSVEQLPQGSTGALTFGEDGVILVQNKRICWALSSDMRERLTDILCQQRKPPLSRETVEELFRRCKVNGTPIGEALVSGGHLSQEELRCALMRHNGEAIGRIARVRRAPTKFLPHVKMSYDARFVFSSVELFAVISASGATTLVGAATQHLASTLVPGSTGFAFVRDHERGLPVLLATDPGCELAISEALEIGDWSNRVFDVTTFFDQSTSVVSAAWCKSTSVVSWCAEGSIRCAAVCASRPASTLLVTQLARRPSLSSEPAADLSRVGP